MNRNWNNTLLQHLLGELPGPRRKALETRLTDDPQLQSRKQEWQSVITTLRSYQPDFGSGFEQRVMQSIALKSAMALQEKITWRMMLRFGMSAAAAVILLIVWVYMQEKSLSVEHLLGLAGLKTDDFTNLLANY